MPSHISLFKFLNILKNEKHKKDVKLVYKVARNKADRYILKIKDLDISEVLFTELELKEEKGVRKTVKKTTKPTSRLDKIENLLTGFIKEQRTFNSGQRTFNEKVVGFMEKQLTFNSEQRTFNSGQRTFNEKQLTFNLEQRTVNDKQLNFNNILLNLPTIKKEIKN